MNNTNDIKNMMIEQYKKGYREGFDDCKLSLIDALEILLDKNDPNVVLLLSAINEINYE